MTARVFSGGRILPMSSSGMPADVVVIDGDRIVAVGGRDVARSFPDAVVEDLGGRILCPGFIDAHHHLSISALQPRWADLTAAATMEEVGVALADHAAREPEGAWIRGAGWTDLGTGLVPHRHDLDALGLDRPVIVAHYSLHQAVVDSRGLDELGIGRTSSDPTGGVIGRDPDGSPDGLLVERAWSEAHARSLAPFSDPDRWADHIEVAARRLLRDGITAVHDAACAPPAEAAYRTLAAGGRLPISVLVMPHPTALLGAPETARLSGPPTGDGDRQVRVGPIKLFADGGVLPAIDVHLGGEPLRVGTLFSGLAEDVELAVSRDFRVAVHAIGNAGLSGALDAFEATARRHPDVDHRFRVEHACLASAPQLARLARVGGVAVVQPGFLHHLGRAVEGVTFDDATWLPFADIRRSGAVMAASSDAPCTFHDPLRAAGNGASRRTGSGAVLDLGQAVTYEDWLWAYTAGAAYAGSQEAERGALVPGLLADLVVLEGALDADHPPRVAETWVAGDLAYRARAPGG
ncbi:MAG TPA: amidohydrolase [Acidimicrobiales bacterium]|nr:amidohydrolase [Acidimicrobiales bacterium]